jgi:signal transduction histidine kinase
MKLQKKISLYFFFISLVVFVLSSIASFYALRTLVLEEVDETLEVEMSNLISQLKKLNEPTNYLENHSYRLEIYPIDDNIKPTQSLNDTLIYLGEEDEGVPFRQLKLSQTINGKNYMILLRRSLIERDDLITGLTITLVIIFALIFLSLNLINYFGEKKWWKPFYNTLDKLSSFNLAHKAKISFSKSDIDEFNKLNETLEEMTVKMRKDFQNLKEFTENASHEMQTPLAIIRSKLDVMIQDKSLSENQFNTIGSLYDAVNRLAKLNQSLNLLTKIENEEFEQKELVNISELILEQLRNSDELIKSKFLEVNKNIENDVTILINPLMAETLISNLLINAIKHNEEKGKILIQLNSNYLEIKNTGKPPQTSTDELFERFKKDKQTSDSPGLGLSIVKKICELNKFNIEYNFVNGFHTIKVNFK